METNNYEQRYHLTDNSAMTYNADNLVEVNLPSSHIVCRKIVFMTVSTSFMALTYQAIIINGYYIYLSVIFIIAKFELWAGDNVFCCNLTSGTTNRLLV